MLTKYLSIGLDLKNKFKIHSKKPKLRKTHFVIYLSKMNVYCRVQKSLLLYRKFISFELYEQNASKKANFEEYLANFVMTVNTSRLSSQAAKSLLL